MDSTNLLPRCANSRERDRTLRRCTVSRIIQSPIADGVRSGWELDLHHNANTERKMMARNPLSKRRSSRGWHLVKIGRLRELGFEVGIRKGCQWEVDWTYPENTGTYVMARNLASHIPKARQWRMVSTATLRTAGINTPTYRKDSWEVDWSQRSGKRVWARNVHSKNPPSREWHWIDHSTLDHAGIQWKPAYMDKGRSTTGDGYIILSKAGMTDDEIALCDKHNLWNSKKHHSVREHRVVAVKKFGVIPEGNLVRHLDGDKANNAADNLVLGTEKENAYDHHTAVRMAMYWHNRHDDAQAELTRLRKELGYE